MNRRAPCAISPQAKTSGAVVWYVSRLTLISPRSRLDAVGRIEEREVGGLPDGEDDAVGRDVLDVRSRRSVGLKRPLRIEDRGAAHGAQAGDLAVLAQDLARPALIVQVDAFLGAFVDFDLVGGHLLAAFQADHVDFFIAADAQRRARDVVGD